MIKKERKRGKVILFVYISVSEPPHFRRLRLRLLVNCKVENYEFVTPRKKNISFPDTKLQNLHVRLQEKLFRVLDPHFFSGSGSASFGYPGEGGSDKGKK